MQKITNYIICFLVFIIISRTGSLARSDFFLIFVFIASLLIYFSRKGRIDRDFTRLIFFSVVLSLTYLIIKGNLDFYTTIGFFITIWIAFLFIRILKNDFFQYIINYVFFLTVLSLPFFILQLTIPGTFIKINDLLGLCDNSTDSSSIIFVFRYAHLYRNSGFMWEPGGFAAVLTIVLFINIAINNKLFSFRNIILLIAILTTFSTLGYISLLVHGFLILKKARLKIAHLIFFVILFIAFFNTGFVVDKIISQYEGAEEELYRAYDNQSQQEVIGLTRFASILVDLNTFMNHPFLGLGPDVFSSEDSVVYESYSKNINRASGIMSILLKFGAIGFLIYFYLMFKSLRKNFSRNVCFMFLLLIFFVLLSNPIETSIFVLFFFFLKYAKKNELEIMGDDKEPATVLSE